MRKKHERSGEAPKAKFTSFPGERTGCFCCSAQGERWEGGAPSQRSQKSALSPLVRAVRLNPPGENLQKEGGNKAINESKWSKGRENLVACDNDLLLHRMDALGEIEGVRSASSGVIKKT